MKGLKKTLAVAMAAALLTTVAAGCANTPASSGGTNSQGSGTSGDASTTTEKHTFTAMVRESSNQYCRFADRDKYLVWQELNKIFESKGLEIKFDVVQEDQYETVLATSLASTADLAEYINLEGADDATLISGIENGIFLPINDLIDNGDGTSKAFLEKYSQVYKKASYTDGKMYWMPALQETYYDGKLGSTCTNVLIRYDWVKKLGIEVPKTLDEYTNYLKACQEKDLNGNGQKDEYYVAAWKDFSSGIPQWFGLPNDRFGLSTNDGIVVSTWEQPGVKDYFRYIQKLLKEGLTSVDYIACETAVTDAANANNQAASLSSYCMQGWLEPEVNVPEGDEAANYVSLMPIQGTDGVKPISNIEPPQLTDWRHAAFTKNLKDKEAASIFLDILYSDKFEDLNAWGIEGTTYEVRDGIKILIGDATGADWEAASISGECNGSNIWGFAFPVIRFSDMENEIATISKEKGDAQKEVIDYPDTMVDNMKAYMAVPTAEENETLSKYESAYKALSREIAVKIYKGELDIDNDWDAKVIKPLKEGGMDELLKVYQARADRYFNYGK